MLVKFRVNLGSQDAAKFKDAKIDYKSCLVGETVEIEESAAREFVRLGIAEEVVRARGIAKPAEITGVKA